MGMMSGWMGGGAAAKEEVSDTLDCRVGSLTQSYP